MKLDITVPPVIRVILSIWLRFSLVAPSAFAQMQIRVRVLDAEFGKPIRRIYITLDGSNAGKFQTAEDISWTSMSQKTDLNGEVIFQLPDAVPQFLSVSSGPIDLHHYSEHVLSANEIVRAGVVASYRYDPQKPCWCPRLKAQVSPKSGEIVIFDKRFTKWEHLLQEIP